MAGISAVGNAVKSGFQEISGKIAAINAKTASDIEINDAVTDALMAEMKPLKKNTAFYIIAGVALVLILMTGIILIKRK